MKQIESILENTTGSFNKEMSVEDYQNAPPFLGGVPGLVDTIHKKYPQIRSLFKKLKSLDWSEDEFKFEKCNADFKAAYASGDKASKDLADIMIETIMWQWEADSNVSSAPISILSLMEPCAEIWEAESEISKNELIHANTYSEVVRLSWDNPADVMREVLAKQEPLKRLEVVEKMLGYVRHEFLLQSLGQSTKTESELKQLIINFYFVLFCLERIQFMASFAITFTVVELAKAYQPIGEAVQKICQDEYETHQEIRREVLNVLAEVWPEEFALCKDMMSQVFNTVVNNEFAWTESLFAGRSVTGLDANVIKQWILFNAADVYYAMGTLPNVTFDFPTTNPMPTLNTWISLDLLQNAQQEGDSTAYKVGIVDLSPLGKLGSNKF